MAALQRALPALQRPPAPSFPLLCPHLIPYPSPPPPSHHTQELPALLAQQFPDKLDLSRSSIMGHSMGGHGALTIALKNPSKWVARARLRHLQRLGCGKVHAPRADALSQFAGLKHCS